MRPSTLAAFLTTVAIAVPAGWHALDADLRTDGKKFRPLQQEFVVDGARVTLDVDREQVITGDSVVAKLVAFSETPKTVSVDLHVIQSRNYAGERVEIPSTQIDREVVTLRAEPNGGKPVTTKIRLGEPVASPGLTDSFRLIAVAHGTKAPQREYYEEQSDQPSLRDDWDQLAYAGEGGAAAISVTGWSGNTFPIEIKTDGPATVDEPFVVTMSVKNTTKHAMGEPYFSLALSSEVYGPGDADPKFLIGELQNNDVNGEGKYDDNGRRIPTWKRGQTRSARFVITPQMGVKASELALLGSAIVWQDQPGPVEGGAKDIKVFPLIRSKEAETTTVARN